MPRRGIPVAKVRFEPKVTDAALCAKVGFSGDEVYQVNGRLLDALYAD